MTIAFFLKPKTDRNTEQYTRKNISTTPSKVVTSECPILYEKCDEKSNPCISHSFELDGTPHIHIYGLRALKMYLDTGGDKWPLSTLPITAEEKADIYAWYNQWLLI